MRNVIFLYIEVNNKTEYPFEGISAFRGPMRTIEVEGVLHVIARYDGAATEAELPTYDPPSVEVIAATGAGVIFFDPANPSELIVKKGSEVVITANSDAPEGSWFMPVQAPINIKYASVEKLPNADTINITVTFDESGDWQLTEALINRDLPEDSKFEFAGIKIKVIL